MTLTRSPFVTTALLLAVCATNAESAAVHFEDFASVQGVELVGAAAVFGNAMRLTPAKRNKMGAVWLCEKQPILNRFETRFRFQLSQPSRLFNGADGFAFVLQNSGPKAIGGRGSAGGFGVADRSNSHQPGIPWSFAVHFDTWENRSEGDTSGNYIAVRTLGRPAQMRWPADRLASTRKLDVEMKDGAVHMVRILFERPVINVFLDDATIPVLQTALDLAPVADAQGSAWVGFTASTGWGFENHDILNWSFEGEKISSDVSMVSTDVSFPMSECLADHNLCTPERNFVEHTGNRYHIVLPGNLEWGVRIPTSKEAKVNVTSAHGTVCWDLKGQGSAGCTGPSGKEGHAEPGFLDQDAPAGSLVTRIIDGATCFSVNDRTGDEFKDNEGFYEFDVEVR